MFEIGIVGAKNSGKTTLLEKIINHFSSSGKKVATIKHTGHDHKFDTQGKDSYRHREAGAKLTVAIGKAELALFSECEDLYLEYIQKMIAENFDLLFVEGDKRSSREKIFLTRNMKNLRGEIPGNIIATYGTRNTDLEVEHFGEDEFTNLLGFIEAQFDKISRGEQNVSS